jgi:hypothetical protein
VKCVCFVFVVSNVAVSVKIHHSDHLTTFTGTFTDPFPAKYEEDHKCKSSEKHEKNLTKEQDIIITPERHDNTSRRIDRDRL